MSNFSVLSLLGRKSSDKEKEKKSLADNCSNKKIHYPSSGEDDADDIDETEQFPEVKKENCRFQI